MEAMTKFLAELLFNQARQAFTDLAPMLTTAVVGFITLKVNEIVKSQTELKGAQIKTEKIQALQYAAVTFVRSQYEKDRAAFKSPDPNETGVDPGKRKFDVLEHLRTLFPELTEQDIDAACDAAVFVVRSEKIPVDPSH